GIGRASLSTKLRSFRAEEQAVLRPGPARPRLWPVGQVETDFHSLPRPWLRSATDNLQNGGGILGKHAGSALPVVFQRRPGAPRLEQIAIQKPQPALAAPLGPRPCQARGGKGS